MKRWYLCEIIGDGSDEEPFRPASADLVTANWGATDNPAGGWMIVEADVDAAQHATLFADARVLSMETRDAGGRELDLDEPLSAATQAYRDGVVALLTARGIDARGIDGRATMRDVVHTVEQHCNPKATRRLTQTQTQGAET